MIYTNLESIKVKENDLGGVKLENKSWISKNKNQTVKIRRGGRKNFSSNKTSIRDTRRNCTVKTSYRDSKELHLKNLKYIQKEGKGIDGEKPEIYGSVSLEEYKKNMDSLNWRIILSPDSNKINLNILTESFMKDLEKATGYKFQYVACNHYDTAKHHTHILINGIDKNGRKVQFLPKEVVKELMRNYARNICTQLIGHKTEMDIIQDYENAVQKNYYTALDRKIKNYIEDGKVDKKILNAKYGDILRDRLDYLITLNLARYDKNTMSYYINKDYEEKLKLYGKYNMYLDGLKVSQVGIDKYSLHDVKEKGEIEGEIIKKYIRQNDSNNFALLIRKNDGNVSYVPLPFYPKGCFEGDTVKIRIKNNKNINIIHNKKV